MMFFKFHLQIVKDGYLGPGFALISMKRKRKFERQRNKNIAIFVILGSLVNNRR